jgi:hypothetical protein
MEKLKNLYNWFLSEIKKLDFKSWIIIILAFLSIICGIVAHHYYSKSKTPYIVSGTDSLSIYKNKIKEEYISRDIYVQDVNSLKKRNTDLYNEVKNMKDNPVVVSNTKIVFRTNERLIAKSDSIVPASDTVKSLFWSLNEKNGYYSMKGQTDVKTDFSHFTTSVNSFSIPVNLKLDLVESENQLKIITKSDNPYVTVENTDGALINPKKSKVIKSFFPRKRWTIGPFIGYGFDKDLNRTPFIGIGVSYGIIQW